MAKTAANESAKAAAKEQESHSDIPSVSIYEYVGQENHVTVQVASNHSSWEETSNHSPSYVS